ncbi:uncharacterized protein LOC114274269 [Camellia sinensis]|uniref:uncharacterized protein LOC114274269 n=1 Tax=Camellia sinensis TaxID=4442 RepID=UPI001036B468|nr:uncharacterized protein LOC114274269 [Camellia sinensis]
MSESLCNKGKPGIAIVPVNLTLFMHSILFYLVSLSNLSIIIKSRSSLLPSFFFIDDFTDKFQFLIELKPIKNIGDLEVPAFTAAIEAHQRKISDAIMKHALQICSHKNVKNVKIQIVVGDPKEKACEAIEELHADLLVMGSRAFGPFKRMFLGSVSNYCLNYKNSSQI